MDGREGVKKTPGRNTRKGEGDGKKSDRRECE